MDTKQEMEILGPAIGQRAKVNGHEELLYATYKNLACGCRAVGTGSLQAPFSVEFCPKHAAAPLLYEACKEAVGEIECNCAMYCVGTCAHSKLEAAIAAAEKGE